MLRDPEVPFVVTLSALSLAPFLGLKDRQRWTPYPIQGRVIDRTAWGRAAGERDRSSRPVTVARAILRVRSLDYSGLWPSSYEGSLP